MDIKRVLARNTVWNYAGFVVNLATNLVLFPFVVHRLGESAAGLWLLLSAVTGYMGLMELGLVPALTQFSAAALGRGDRLSLDRAASTSMALLMGLGVLALQLLWLAGPVVAMLNVPDALRGDAQLVFQIAIAGFALRMPLATYQALLLGSQRQDRCNQLWILLGFAKLMTAGVVLTLGYGVVALVAAEALLHLLSGFLQYRWTYQELPGLRLARGLVDLDEARHLTGFGARMVLLGVFVLVVEQTDRVVIGAFLPIAAVTAYSAAWKLYMLGYTVPTTLLQALGPVAAALFGGGDHVRLRRLFLRLTKYSAALALPLALSIGFCASVLLDLWLGPGFVDVAIVVQVLLVSLAVTSYNHAGYSVLVGMRAVTPQLWLYNAPLAVLNLGLSLLLVGPLGILGVALGTAIPAVLLEVPFLHLVLKRLGLGWRQFGREVLVPTLVPALAFVPLAVVRAVVGAHSMWLIPLAAVCSAGYALCLWSLFFPHEERAPILSQLGRWAGADGESLKVVGPEA